MDRLDQVFVFRSAQRNAKCRDVFKMRAKAERVAAAAVTLTGPHKLLIGTQSPYTATLGVEILNPSWFYNSALHTERSTSRFARAQTC
jgi:hypothetical protein